MAKPLLSDERIAELLRLPKQATERDWRRLEAPREPRPNSVFVRADIAMQATTGERFRVIAQRNVRHPQRFALQLAYIDDNGNEYGLLRVAGRAASHTNHLERERLTSPFRVNRLTARYQALPGPEDDFAEPACLRLPVGA